MKRGLVSAQPQPSQNAKDSSDSEEESLSNPMSPGQSWLDDRSESSEGIRLRELRPRDVDLWRTGVETETNQSGLRRRGAPGSSSDETSTVRRNYMDQVPSHSSFFVLLSSTPWHLRMMIPISRRPRYSLGIAHNN